MRRSARREETARRAALWAALVAALLAACGGPAGRRDGDDDPGDAGSADAGPPPLRATTAVRVIVQPGAGMTPVVQAVAGAQKSIRMGMYYLSDSSVIRALVDAKKRGVTVKVLLEDAPMSLSNDSAYNTLNTGGVSVKFAGSRFTYVHEKVLVIDDETLWAMTMNLAPTAATTNREYLLVDTDATDVAQAAAVFDADFADVAAPPADALVLAPENARERIAELFRSAQREILVEWEQFSDWDLRDVLVVMARKGVTIKVLVPADIAGSGTETAMKVLKSSGGQVRKLASPDLHAKMILVDGAVGFVGSINGTRNSLENNRELGVIWRNEAAAATVSTTFNRDFSVATPL